MTPVKAEQPLAELFAAYAGAALPCAGRVQRVEMRRAYFAGCFALRQLLIDGEKASPQVLQALRQHVDVELEVWASTMGTCLEGKV